MKERNFGRNVIRNYLICKWDFTSQQRDTKLIFYQIDRHTYR